MLVTLSRIWVCFLTLVYSLNINSCRIGLYGGKEEKTLSFVTKDLLDGGNKEWSRDWNLNPRSYI